MNNPDKDWTVFDSIDTLRSAINDIKHGHHLILVDGKLCLDENIVEALNGQLNIIKEHIAEAERNALTAEDLRRYLEGSISVVIVLNEGSQIECKIGNVMADTLEFTTIERAIHHIKAGGKK